MKYLYMRLQYDKILQDFYNKTAFSQYYYSLGLSIRIQNILLYTALK